MTWLGSLFVALVRSVCGPEPPRNMLSKMCVRDEACLNSTKPRSAVKHPHSTT